MTDPDHLRLAWEIGLGALVLWNLYVTVRLLLADAYCAPQKIAQLLLIWSLPAVGAVMVLSMMVVHSAARREHYEPGDGPPGMGSDVGHH